MLSIVHVPVSATVLLLLLPHSIVPLLARQGQVMSIQGTCSILPQAVGCKQDLHAVVSLGCHHCKYAGPEGTGPERTGRLARSQLGPSRPAPAANNDLQS